jgi:hypothetical protein
VAEVELPDPEELEERRDKAFSRRVALVTAVYAVVLAIASLGGNNAMKEMLLAQQEASNQWSYYQAKVIREHLNRGNKLILESQLAEPSALRGAEREKLEGLARRFADEEKRMNADKKEIEPKAKAAEAERDLNQAKDPYFDYAEVLLQIAIAAPRWRSWPPPAPCSGSRPSSPSSVPSAPSTASCCSSACPSCTGTDPVAVTDVDEDVRPAHRPRRPGRQRGRASSVQRSSRGG